MSKELVPVNAKFICGDQPIDCSTIQLQPGYAVYKVEDVQHAQAGSAIMAISWCIAMITLTLIFWFKGKSVPEKNADGPTHWSSWVVSTLVWINTAVVIWSAIASS